MPPAWHEDIFGDVAAGGGSIWVATSEGLMQLDPSTMTAAWHEGLAPGRPIAYGFDSVWVANSEEGLVRRVDPNTLEVIAEIAASSAEGMTASPEGIWVTEHQHGTIERIDPATNTIAETIPVGQPGSEGPMDPTLADDEIWFVVPNEGAIVRVDRDGAVTRTPLTDGFLAPVASTEAVWVPLGAAGITRIDRETLAVTSVPPPEGLGGAYTGVNVDGTPWFIGTETMFALDEVTSEVIGTAPLHGGTPRNAVLFDDAVWVMTERAGSLERVPLDQLPTR